MISEKMQASINDQINAELHSGYLYLAMVAYFESENLPGFAAWMRCQAQEENAHAMKFFAYLNERGGRVLLQPIDGPDTEWDSPLAAFEAAYKHECYISSRIHDMVKVAREENDVAAEIFLQWYVSEQVEEEANADEVVQKLKRLAGAPGGLYMVDKELGQRTFTPPAGEGEDGD